MGIVGEYQFGSYCSESTFFSVRSQLGSSAQRHPGSIATFVLT